MQPIMLVRPLSVVSLSILLSGEFTKLVVIAFIPAAVLAWYLADFWLNGFTYRIEINSLEFVLSGLVAIVIAWLTVSYQSLKAAAANPVDSLRYE
jgi:putative ABC transport system permease protein